MLNNNQRDRKSKLIFFNDKFYKGRIIHLWNTVNTIITQLSNFIFYPLTDILLDGRKQALC